MFGIVGRENSIPQCRSGLTRASCPTSELPYSHVRTPTPHQKGRRKVAIKCGGTMHNEPIGVLKSQAPASAWQTLSPSNPRPRQP
eukprot:1177131-Prorocentrum_minimum.AAC.5